MERWSDGVTGKTPTPEPRTSTEYEARMNVSVSLNSEYQTIRWKGGVDGSLELLDQTLLPGEVRYVACPDVETLFEAIRALRVRGAPAIGVARTLLDASPTRRHR